MSLPCRVAYMPGPRAAIAFRRPDPPVALVDRLRNGRGAFRGGAASSRARWPPRYWRGDRLHLLLGVGDDLVEIVVGVVGALQHLQPRPLRRVDLLEEGQRVGRLPDRQRLRHVLHQRLGLEVLVVGHVRAGGQVEELGIALDLHLVREDELHEVDRVVDPLRALRDDDEVAADEGGGRAGLDAGQQR